MLTNYNISQWNLHANTKKITFSFKGLKMSFARCGPFYLSFNLWMQNHGLLNSRRHIIKSMNVHKRYTKVLTWYVSVMSNTGVVWIYRYLTSKGIPMLKIRRSYSRLILTMEIIYLGKTVSVLRWVPGLRFCLLYHCTLSNLNIFILQYGILNSPYHMMGLVCLYLTNALFF